MDIGTEMLKRFEQTKSLSDLDTAAQAFHKVLQDMPVTHPDREKCLNNLGNALRIRFEWSGSLKDLDTAEEMIKEAIKLSSATHSGTLRNLSIVLQCRFRQTRVEQDLHEAVTVAKAALVLEPSGGNYCNLGNALQEVYRQTGSGDDLNEALKAMEAATTLAEDKSSRALYASNLSLILKSEFERTASMDILNAAVTAVKLACDLTPDNHRDKPMYLNNLNHALQIRFDRTQSLDDLNAAHQAITEALRLVLDDSPYRALYLNNLGSVLRSRYELTGSIEDIRDAVNALTEANEITSPQHSDKPMYLYNLSGAAQDLFDETGWMEALNIAVSASNLAVELSSDDHVDQVEQLRTLGNALYLKFGQTGSELDFKMAVMAYERSVKLVNASPSSRIKSARACADLLYSQGSIKDASRLLSTAVHLLPATSPRTLRRNDQQMELSNFVGLAADACAVSIRAREDVSNSLQILEIGRGVLDGLHWEIRSDITALNDMHPDLAEKLKVCRTALENSADYPLSANLENPLHSQLARRDGASSDFDKTVQEIRNLPGFSRFFLGPSTDELKSLASQGPLVFINVSEFGSDAFLITCEEIVHLPLPKLVYIDVETNSKAFVERLASDVTLIRRLNSWMRKILEWLWDVAIEPILQRLGFTEQPKNEESWPHVWWIPVGQLNIFPIHAAGYHSVPGQTVIDRVISSYTPTARALQQARNQFRKLSPSTTQTILLASMMKTPKRSDLPYAEIEIDEIDHNLPHAVNKIILKCPTSQNIVNMIAQSSVVHFACHGEVSSDPSKSQILFSDWEVAPFTVAVMSEIKLNKAEFAYISACHTANTRNFALLDEAIHMAKACQLAGFPIVIGTLWQIPDRDSARVAKDVYNAMFGGDKLDVLKAAKGLHFALREIRYSCPPKRMGKQLDEPLTWAAYIHVGA